MRRLPLRSWSWISGTAFCRSSLASSVAAVGKSSMRATFRIAISNCRYERGRSAQQGIAERRGSAERTHEREDIARLIPAPAREVFAPSDQVAHLNFERPFLPEAVGAEAVTVDEGVVFPELGDKLLQVCDRLGVVDLAAKARCIGATGRLTPVDGHRVDGLIWPR